MFSWLEIFFAVEIKKCTCIRSKKLCSIKSFPGCKTALKLHRNSTLKYHKILLIHPLYISLP